MVMWPGAGLRNGDLDVSDIRDFPGNLRCLLKVKAVLTGGDFDLGDHCVFAGEVQVIPKQGTANLMMHLWQ